MPIPLVFNQDPPGIKHSWQIQSQFPLFRVDGDFQQALKYDLIRKFVPCGGFETPTGSHVGFYRWMNTLLSIVLYISEDGHTVYCKDHNLFSDVFRLYLGGAKQVYFVWEIFSRKHSDPRIFHISIDHAEAVYTASRGLKTEIAPQHAVSFTRPRRRAAPYKDKEGGPNPTWIHESLPSEELQAEESNRPRNVAPRARRKTHAVPHPEWPLAPML